MACHISLLALFPAALWQPHIYVQDYNIFLDPVAFFLTVSCIPTTVWSHIISSCSTPYPHTLGRNISTGNQTFHEFTFILFASVKICGLKNWVAWLYKIPTCGFGNFWSSSNNLKESSSYVIGFVVYLVHQYVHLALFRIVVDPWHLAKVLKMLQSIRPLIAFQALLPCTSLLAQ